MLRKFLLMDDFVVHFVRDDLEKLRIKRWRELVGDLMKQVLDGPVVAEFFEEISGGAKTTSPLELKKQLRVVETERDKLKVIVKRLEDST